jgi:hypothetical protein
MALAIVRAQFEATEQRSFCCATLYHFVGAHVPRGSASSLLLQLKMVQVFIRRQSALRI